MVQRKSLQYQWELCTVPGTTSHGGGGGLLSALSCHVLLPLQLCSCAPWYSMDFIGHLPRGYRSMWPYLIVHRSRGYGCLHLDFKRGHLGKTRALNPSPGDHRARVESLCREGHSEPCGYKAIPKGPKRQSIESKIILKP